MPKIVSHEVTKESPQERLALHHRHCQMSDKQCNKISLKENVVGEWKKEEPCIICYMGISATDEVQHCPSCEISFHSLCITTWLTTKDTCPICHKPWKKTTSR